MEIEKLLAFPSKKPGLPPIEFPSVTEIHLARARYLRKTLHRLVDELYTVLTKPIRRTLKLLKREK